MHEDFCFDREVAVRHGSRYVNVEIMVPEYKNNGDTETLIHFGVGPTSKKRVLAYLDGVIEGERK